MASFDVDQETWALLNRLLDQALDLPSDAREGWLDALPEEHRPLRAKLAELLSHAEQESRFATLPKIEAAPAQYDRAGAHVGPYRLDRRLGEGGMGAVWLAERSDGILRRSVALKLPRSSEARPELAERIAREREILAALNHPNIAKRKRSLTRTAA